MARLRAGTVSGDVTEATALLAMLLAATGDPTAARFWAYVEDARQEDTTTELQAIGVIRATLAWSPPSALRFVTVIDGQRTTVDLEPGEGHRLLLTPSQAASFAIEPIEGRIGLITVRRDAAVLDDIEPDPDLTITRSVDPAGDIAASDLVVVDLVVAFGAQAPDGCHLVTELVPSGLTPVGVRDGWFDDETGEEVVGVDYPLEQVGQRVTFCAERPIDGAHRGAPALSGPGREHGHVHVGAGAGRLADLGRSGGTHAGHDHRHRGLTDRRASVSRPAVRRAPGLRGRRPGRRAGPAPGLPRRP